MNKDIINKILELKSEGFSYEHLTKKYGCSVDLIKSWIANHKKSTNTYNLDHINEKYELNIEFFKAINPKTILDLYCGRSRFWASNFGTDCLVISNDNLKDKEARPDYKMTMNADQLLQAYLVVDKHFDLIDVDPYGSPKDCLNAAIQLADKGLILTFGDFKSCKRFSNKDRNLFYELYGITLPKEKITIDYLADYIVKLSNFKFKVWNIASWKNCDRVYFIKEEGV